MKEPATHSTSSDDRRETLSNVPPHVPTALSDGLGNAETEISSYPDALQSISRVAESSSQLAVATVDRLMRTTASWITTLENRQERLETEIAAIRTEISELDALIERERANAQHIVQSTDAWAKAAQEEISRKRSRVLDDSVELDKQFRDVASSIQEVLSHPVSTDQRKDIQPGADLNVGRPETQSEPHSDMQPQSSEASGELTEEHQSWWKRIARSITGTP